MKLIWVLLGGMQIASDKGSFLNKTKEIVHGQEEERKKRML